MGAALQPQTQAATVRLSPNDFVRSLDLSQENAIRPLKDAYEAGRNLSVHLEAEMPEGEFKDGLDAFTRLLSIYDIKTRSLPHHGIHADEMEVFLKTPGRRLLFHEWITRQFRSVAFGQTYNTRSLWTSLEAVNNSALRPVSDRTDAIWDTPLAPDIPVQELLAMQNGINGKDYRKLFVTNSTANQRLKRIGEGAEFPRVKLTVSDETLQLAKFGVAVEFTYETMRRYRLNVVSLHLQRIAAQNEADKVTAILDIIVNGDGTTGSAAAVSNLTTLDTAAVAGTLTLKGLLAFKMLFQKGITMTTIIAQDAPVLQMLLLTNGSANIPLVSIQGASGFGMFEPIRAELGRTIRYGWSSDAPSLKLIGFDRRQAVERVFEVGGTISETEDFVLRQTRAITVSEVEAYAIVDPNAARILDVNA
jgi:hypothetical protein